MTFVFYCIINIVNYNIIWFALVIANVSFIFVAGSNIPHTVIEFNTTKVLGGDTFSLLCAVKVDKGVAIQMTWSYPAKGSEVFLSFIFRFQLNENLHVYAGFYDGN